jgi:hypothetical protein
MKALAFSDLHDEEAAFESLRSIAGSYDRVFICGDTTQSVEFAQSVVDSFPKACIIPGNWDSEAVDGVLSGSRQWLHGKRIELGEGLNAVGFGFSPPTPFGTYGELSEKEIYERMSELEIDKDTILLLHCPPKNNFDDVHIVRRIGSDSILRIIEERKPLAAMFGHVHEHMGVKKLGRTTLIKLPPANTMRACSVSINDKRISVEFISL